MPTNEDGEFELILGNRQLLSVFFIVVVLLGVFFTMGYIVGRNSAPAGAQEVASIAKTDTKPIVVDSAARDKQAPALPPVTTKPTETAPQQPPEAEQKKAPEAVKQETAKAKAPEPPARVSNDPPTGGQTYLQLVATAKAEADVMVDVLRKKGFQARNAEIPEKLGTFRVLVGPLDADAINKTRADLQSAGFPGDKAIRKTF